MAKEIERILARLNRIDTLLADVDEKLRHIIRRLPDEFDSGRASPAPGDDDTSDSPFDSEDD